MNCWICGANHATPMMLPAFVRPVPICGTCIVRAMRIIERRNS